MSRIAIDLSREIFDFDKQLLVTYFFSKMIWMEFICKYSITAQANEIQIIYFNDLPSHMEIKT
jgi:hypothetical protein